MQLYHMKKKYELYNQIAKEIYVYLDVGVSTSQEIEELIDLDIDRIIIPTETFIETTNLRTLRKRYGNRLIVSIDIKEERVLSPHAMISALTPQEILRMLMDIGFNESILIDLDRVGSYMGVNLELIEKLVNEDIKLYVGGGIRNINDIIYLETIGVEGVLVASSLHDKTIRISELIEYGYL